MPDLPIEPIEARIVESYTPTILDLGVYRIGYATFLLVAIVPTAAWLSHAPSAFFNPPLGLPAVLTGYPPVNVVLAGNILLSLFAAMLLVGARTTVASIGVATTLLLLNACSYSLGKINHDILLVIVPLALASAGWGGALSVDAARRPPPRQCGAGAPMLLLALVIGSAMFVAGWSKASSGWLDPELRCTFGNVVQFYVAEERPAWAVPWIFRVESGWFWKFADWFAVGLELAFLPAALHRRSFCLVLALATIFHLGVLALFDIQFSWNVVAYGAFVRYGQAPFLRNLQKVRPLGKRAALVLFGVALALGIAATLCGEPIADALRVPVHRLVVCAGAAVGAWYLLMPLRKSVLPSVTR
jgi:hypothetical protein